jgi:hypothetical protein
MLPIVLLLGFPRVALGCNPEDDQDAFDAEQHLSSSITTIGFTQHCDSFWLKETGSASFIAPVVRICVGMVTQSALHQPNIAQSDNNNSSTKIHQSRLGTVLEP